MPFTDVVEARIVVIGALEKCPKASDRLFNAPHECGDGSPPMDGNVFHLKFIEAGMLGHQHSTYFAVTCFS